MHSLKVRSRGKGGEKIKGHDSSFSTHYEIISTYHIGQNYQDTHPTLRTVLGQELLLTLKEERRRCHYQMFNLIFMKYVYHSFLFCSSLTGATIIIIFFLLLSISHKQVCQLSFLSIQMIDISITNYIQICRSYNLFFFLFLTSEK